MQFKKPTDDVTGPNIAPLLDVVLLLLIFFVVTSSFAEREIALDLPHAEAARQQADRDLVVNVLADGRILVGHEELPNERLESLLTQTAAAGGSLEIRADASASHGSVVRILDRARRAGILRVGFATQATHATDATPSPAGA